MPGGPWPDMSCRRDARLTDDLARNWRRLGLLSVACAAVFLLFPGLDPALSRLFYTPGAGFVAAGNPGIERVRMIFWNLSSATFALALVGLLVALIVRRPVLGQDAWRLGFIVTLYLLGPVLIVNRLFKEHWGRARPADITPFGGTAQFTPFWQPSEQCLSNCSFVSGEVSGTTATTLALLLIAPGLARWIGAGGVRILGLAAFCLPWIVALQRIAAGRHFLSDAVFSVLLTLAVALLLAPVFRRGRHANGTPPQE